MSNQGQPKITIETITPTIAKSIMEKNSRNRTINRHQVAKIATYMRTNGFRLTGDPIRIGADGTLFDGQHRLAACIEANTPFDTVVIRELPDDVLYVIDSGKSRSTRDKLEIARSIKPWVTDCIISLLQMTDGYGVARTVRADHLALIIEKHPAITETATAYKTASRFGMLGAIAAAELILKANGYQTAAAYWRALWVDGLSDPSTRAALAFRQRLIANVEASPNEKWSLSKKMNILPTIIIRTAQEADAPKVWRADLKRFPSVGYNRLMSGIDFNTNRKTEPAMMTLVFLSENETPSFLDTATER